MAWHNKQDHCSFETILVPGFGCTGFTSNRSLGLNRATSIVLKLVQPNLGIVPLALDLGYWTLLLGVVAWRVWRYWSPVQLPALAWATAHRSWQCRPHYSDDTGLGLQWLAGLQLLGWRTLCNSGVEPAEAAWCRLQRKEFEQDLLNKLRQVTHIFSLAPIPYTYFTAHLTHCLAET